MRLFALAFSFFMASMVTVTVRAAASPDEVVLSRERLVFRTNVGDIAVALYPEVAPQTVAQILKLAKLGVFNDVTIYRVEPGFVAQIENFDHHQPRLPSKVEAEIGRVPLEVSDVKHRRGVLSMARYDDPDSAEASFSFVLGDAASLNREYAVFGEIVSGLDVLEQFEKNAVNGRGGKPRDLVISRTDVYEDGDLAGAALTPAHEFEAPNSRANQIFLIFALCAFGVTILKPIYESLRPAKPVAA